MQYGISWKMYICLKCYDERGENAMVFDTTRTKCAFCDEESNCFDLPIHALKHWRDVLKHTQD